jgi:hypothetical protein
VRYEYEATGSNIGFGYWDLGTTHNSLTCVGHSNVQSRVSEAARGLTEMATTLRHRHNLVKKLSGQCTNE